MADLYPAPYSPRDNTQQSIPYNPVQSTSSSSSSDDHQDSKSTNTDPKPETKPQATFLTKLYALLERTENHHMIRWDPAGEHIIVERPEQLALHVLPSIYRQSRFASFSRQLNIYGFMRKVNLRNVDPAIDDPDASTWSHPTLNRHSAPDVVANFKRRVPPRLPKPRKRDTQEQPTIPPPRTSMGMSNVPLSGPPGNSPHKISSGPITTRARGFSAPGSFPPLGHNSSWGTSYQRSALPPLTVPSDPPHLSHPSSLYSNSPHTLHPISSAADDSNSAAFPSMSSYTNSNRDLMSSQYSYNDQHNWSFSSNNASSTHAHNSSLSSLLNPSSGGYSRSAQTINSSYGSPFSSIPMQTEHSTSSMSPDSRPNTGYSMSSVSSMPYQDDHMNDYSRPGSSHRPISPSRPHSSKANYPAGTLSVRRARRHSQAMSPYPSPYDHHPEQQRPSSSPRPVVDDHSSANTANGLPRARSMIQLPSVDPYGFNPSQAEFAYSAIPGQGATMDMNESWAHRGPRPSTSTSSMSAASHTSSSQANTPPLTEDYSGINRFSPDFGFVQMNEHLPIQYNKTPGEL